MLRLTPDKLTNRGVLPHGIKPTGIGNTSIVYLHTDHAEVFTIEEYKCMWLNCHISGLALISDYEHVTDALYTGYNRDGFRRATLPVYRYTAPLWQASTPDDMKLIRKLNKQIRKAADSAPYRWQDSRGKHAYSQWNAIYSAVEHPAVQRACGFVFDYGIGDSCWPDFGLNDWAIVNGELQCVDPVHAHDLTVLHWSSKPR